MPCSQFCSSPTMTLKRCRWSFQEIRVAWKRARGDDDGGNGNSKVNTKVAHNSPKTGTLLMYYGVCCIYTHIHQMDGAVCDLALDDIIWHRVHLFSPKIFSKPSKLQNKPRLRVNSLWNYDAKYAPRNWMLKFLVCVSACVCVYVI